MRSAPAGHRRFLRSVPALAVGLVLALPCAAEARGGGGGGFGAFHGGALHRGFGCFPAGGIVVAPFAGHRGLPGVGVPGIHRLRHGGGPHPRAVVVAPPGRAVLPPARGGVTPHGLRAMPLRGTGVPVLGDPMIPPLSGTAVPPLGGVRSGPGIGMAQIWWRDGGVWHLDPAELPAAVWRRGPDGIWRPNPAGAAEQGSRAPRPGGR